MKHASYKIGFNGLWKWQTDVWVPDTDVLSHGDRQCSWRWRRSPCAGWLSV